MAADGSDAMVKIKVDGTFETHDTGTITGLFQVDGTTTVAGT
jgi:hypothetical protein